MKVIGLIGGMSYISTIEYYKIINQECSKVLGKHQTPRMVITSINFKDLAMAMHKGEWKIIEGLVVDSAKTLRKAGVDFAIICCNSAHKIFNQAKCKIKLPLIHILDPIGIFLTDNAIKKVGILGTKFVMEDPFYRDYLYENFNIEGISPTQKQQEVIHEIIYEELCHGMCAKDSRKKLGVIVEDLQSNGAQGIVLGCTELLIGINQSDYTIPIIDSTDTHAKYAFYSALGCQKEEIFNRRRNRNFKQRAFYDGVISPDFVRSY